MNLYDVHCKRKGKHEGPPLNNHQIGPSRSCENIQMKSYECRQMNHQFTKNVKQLQIAMRLYCTFILYNVSKIKENVYSYKASTPSKEEHEVSDAVTDKQNTLHLIYFHENTKRKRCMLGEMFKEKARRHDTRKHRPPECQIFIIHNIFIIISLPILNVDFAPSPF